ncbi:N-acetylmuramic acid 6-phosphate etherase [Actinosynnema sp. NPDC047251]|uniref:N-acetylmuramic acid 6-phosphate etherase n=1 Tax=Saccharothrix espanaensis (strain ATCC 51144 / DSM 44229 / JCM 9112 / NBRC 15066 / NRRL 15764) TaxID=1179773 RepID=K0JS67_SACES|nr:N-acetylmuramic acid 6-phosphate etherase [Saccharothrix espanaensis]CCH27644.1 N-acetylmuramic acid 6-phosphate etherase [Saccharothrix espanaensis DSM 44229]
MTPPRHDVAIRVESPTEARNPRTEDIDRLSTLDVLRLINSEDHQVPDAVAAVLPELARAADLAVGALRAGHRVHYVGAGTSGRLATLDAAELVPTFNAPPDWFVAHHAGGSEALVKAVEDVEDAAAGGAAQIRRHAAAGDLVLGLTASGRTPFVVAALAEARTMGAHTVLVSNNPIAPPVDVDVLIAVDTGPEAIAGSTRMKAGTSQKLVLTSFSTAVMVRLGRTYSNLMVSMRATNAKLRGRTVRILREATGLGEDECTSALADAGGELKVALVHLLADVPAARAAEALDASGGHVRHALSLLSPGATG